MLKGIAYKLALLKTDLSGIQMV